MNWGKLQRECHRLLLEIFPKKEGYKWLAENFGINHFSELKHQTDLHKLEEIYEKLKERLEDKWPVRVYTSPKIRVGIEKDLCPNLIPL